MMLIAAVACSVFTATAPPDLVHTKGAAFGIHFQLNPAKMERVDKGVWTVTFNEPKDPVALQAALDQDGHGVKIACKGE